MHARQMSSLLLAIVLAFPPGWCCTGGGMSGRAKSGNDRGDVKQGQTANASKARSADVPLAACCRGKTSRSQPGKAPVRSAFRCCCLRDALRTQDGPELSATGDLSLPVTIEAELTALPVHHGLRAEAFFVEGFGPPLHVLQCVWQC